MESGGGIGWAMTPVAARVNGTFMANCGEGSLRIYKSSGWWWVRNDKWQQSYVICCVMGEKWAVAMNIAVELDGPVVARVKGTSVENCEGGGRMYQSGGWWWMSNGK